MTLGSGSGVVYVTFQGFASGRGTSNPEPIKVWSVVASEEKLKGAKVTAVFEYAFSQPKGENPGSYQYFCKSFQNDDWTATMVDQAYAFRAAHDP